MNRKKAIVGQHLYWTDLIKDMKIEVKNDDTFQNTKRSNIKCGKFPAKLPEEILWHKLCVDIIVAYTICRKGKNK